MKPDSAHSRWENLQAKAHLPEVQVIIRHEISRGTIRVVPAPGGGIRIIPESGTQPIERPVPSAIVGLGLDEAERREPVPSNKRRAR